MLKLSAAEKKFITENLGSEFAEARKLNDILDALDDWITENGFDDNEDLTDSGRQAQKIYDSIYTNNL
ncbi:MAG TPA: hypothetical protein H9668_00080 [Firmicutes bacterium]|nr:hypothetical protein [Bacillota bacterium]